jgi:hypothetical protein
LPAIPVLAGPWSRRPWKKKTRSGRIGSGEFLVQERVRVENRIAALLATQGLLRTRHPPRAPSNRDLCLPESGVNRHAPEGRRQDDVADDHARRAVGKSALRAWIAHCYVFRRGPSQVKFDCRPRPAPPGDDVREAEGRWQVAEPNAFAPPPCVRRAAEEL